MSAYTQQGPNGQVIPIGTSNPESDGILGLSQQIETALALGREQIRKLREDIAGMQTRHYQTLGEAERRLQEGNAREQQLKQALTSQQQSTARRERILQTEINSQRERADTLARDLENALRQLERVQSEARQKIESGSQREERLKAEVASLRSAEAQLQSHVAQLQSRVGQLQEAITKGRGELELYKNSWAQVLQMERDARAYIQRKNETEARIRALEARNMELLSEAKSRIQALEAANTGLASELAAARRTVDEERANAGCALKSAEEERARAQELKAAAEAATEAAAAAAEAPVEIQVTSLSDEFEKIASARVHLEAERDALKAQLAQAGRELSEMREKADRMRRNYPLRDLLAHKDAELTRAVRELKKLPEDAPGRDKAETLVEMLSEQRDQLRNILRDSELTR